MKSDFEAWRREMYQRKLNKDLPDYLEFNGVKYFPIGKKKHICLVTDSDWDKNYIEKIFEGRAVYKVCGSKYPFDAYDDERNIIFDEFIPDLQLLINASNVYQTLTPVYGDTRHRVKYWPMKEERWLILLLKDIPSYAEIPEFKSRFNIIDLRKRIDIKR